MSTPESSLAGDLGDQVTNKRSQSRLYYRVTRVYLGSQRLSCACAGASPVSRYPYCGLVTSDRHVARIGATNATKFGKVNKFCIIASSGEHTAFKSCMSTCCQPVSYSTIHSPSTMCQRTIIDPE
jgi:hypothetical protein